MANHFHNRHQVQVEEISGKWKNTTNLSIHVASYHQGRKAKLPPPALSHEAAHIGATTAQTSLQ